MINTKPNQLIRQFALEDLKFDLIGVAKPNILVDELERVKRWCSHNNHGAMKWLADSVETRANPFTLLNNCRSVIVVGANYYNYHPDKSYKPDQPDQSDRLLNATSNNRVLIARYTWGMDYRKVIKSKLKKLGEFIASRFQNADYVITCDSEPIFEKSWAVKAGLGWQGKHSIIISPEIGSWFVIGILLSSVEFETTVTLDDQCGSCSACIKACPTGAIISPKVIDARKCISYQTIEEPRSQNNKVPETIMGWGFGCDICQEVCPFNIKLALPSEIPEFYPRENSADPNNDYWNQIINSPREFKEIYSDSSLKRRKCINPE